MRKMHCNLERPVFRTTSTCNFSYLFVYLSPSLKTPLYTGVLVWQQMCDRWQIKSCFSSFPSCPTLVHDATFNCHYRYCQQALEAQTVCFVGSVQPVSNFWNRLFGASAQPVRRHCDTCSEALWQLYNSNVHPVQQQCSPRATALFTPCNDLVHPVKWHCSLLWNAALSAVWWHREKCSKMLRKRRFSFLFVICHAFVVTRKRLYTKAFSVMVTNKQIKTKICM